MAEQLQTIVCQRCGRGFILTDNYCKLRARRGAAVVEPVLCPNCFLKKGPLPKERGKVKWFNPHKHYGFIVTAQTKRRRGRQPGFICAMPQKAQRR